MRFIAWPRLPAMSALLAAAVALRDPQRFRELGIVAADLFDEAFGVLAADEYVDGVAQRARRRERVVNYGVDDHET